MEKKFHWIRFTVFILLIASCKSKKITSDSGVAGNMSAKAIVKAHYQNQTDFKTLSGRMKIDYFDGESSQGFTVSLRMEKDKAIWISAPLGVVKAYITPERVSFYNKLQNEYFDGDFSYLSRLLGTELDFGKVQNLLMGQALFDLREAKYLASVENNSYVLKPKKPLNLFKVLFMIEPDNYRMASLQLTQPVKRRVLDVEYRNYQQINEKIVPNEIMITASEADIKNEINLNYRNIEFNKNLRFPYKIPKGYRQIVLDASAL